MKLEQLLYIIEVSKCGSISAAARNIFVQQSTISTAIKTIESEFHITLFYRNFSGVELTEEGKKFIELAEEMITLYHEMHRIGTLTNLRCTIYINPFLKDYFTSIYFEELHRRFPDSSITILEAEPEQMQKLISESKEFSIGIGVCHEDVLDSYLKQMRSSKLTIEPLFSSGLKLYVNNQSEFIGKKEITLEDLRTKHLAFHPYTARILFSNGMDKNDCTYTIFDHTIPLLRSVIKNNTAAIHIEPSYVPNPRNREFGQDMIPLPINELFAGNYVHCLIFDRTQITCDQERELIDMLYGSFYKNNAVKKNYLTSSKNA